MGLGFVLFFVLSPLLLLYVSGYRFSSDGTVEYTGTLYIRSAPKNASVSLLGELQPIDTPASFNGLQEKLYPIEVFKDGFHSWSKTLAVEQGVVTRSDLLYLFPNDVREKVVVDEQVVDFALSPDQDTAAVILGTATDGRIELFSVSRPAERDVLLHSNEIDDAEIVQVRWSPNGEQLLVTTRRDGALSYGVLAVGSRSDNFQQLALFDGLSQSDVQWHPRERNQLMYRRTNDEVHVIDLATNTVSVLFDTPVSSFSAVENGVLYHRKEDQLFYRFDYASGDHEQLTREVVDAAAPSEESLFHVSQDGSVALLSARGDLYLIDRNDASGIRLIDSGVTSVSWQGGSKKLAYTTSNELWAYMVTAKDTYPQLPQGHRELLTRTSEPVLFARWFFSYEYVLYATPSGLFAAELDGRDIRNIVRLADIQGSQPFLEYIVSDEQLYVWDETLRTLVLPDK